MQHDKQLTVNFDGLRTGSGPATWGQRTIWKPISWYAPDDHFFNIGLLLPLRHPTAPAEFAQAVGALLERHESLRTCYTADGDSGLTQHLLGSGTLAVRLVHAESQTATAALAGALEQDKALRFDLLAQQPPLRITAVLVAGQVTGAALTLAHIAADATGARVVLDDLRRLLVQRRRAPQVLPPRVPGRQPLEQAAYEASAVAHTRSEAAIALWSRQLDSVPASLWPDPTGPGESERWWEGILDCPRLDLASRLAARRLGSSASAVVLAAVGVELGLLTGRQAVGLKVILGNRASREQQQAVGAFPQNGLVVLGTSGDFDELVGQAWRAQLKTSRHGHYDADAMERAIAAAEKRRGEPIDLTSYFNDHREGPDPALDGAEPAGLPDGAFRWRSRWARQDSAFFFGLATAGGSTTASLLVDTRLFPARQVEPFLRAVQARVVAAVAPTVAATVAAEG
ncbi:condensation domain-containing protein [Kitasatospora sp. NBC_01287]|uniref:condensation domain-containing protein n=1 Tax=Kitasatospora sp. NBC_01287 TaxID=2903573 RepID=UPI00225C0EBF|nr:condensation domain-containing protein [Kitasatospora sp. NBC_01287]MCX4750209.1 condensation domain-containing protein [Kitasatospora sp. NBC_01287]